MDIERDAGLKGLAEAYAAGDLDEEALARHLEELLGSVAPGISDFPAGDEALLDELVSGVVIGPPECRVRLLHDLSGQQRIWLAQVVEPVERAGIFRAIKVFQPEQYTPGIPGEDDRAARADLVGLRAYLAKVRARVEHAIKLDHPSIVAVYAWRQGAGGWPFAEMEYVNPREGRSLEDLMREEGVEGFPWETVSRWLRPVAAALDYARLDHRFAHQHLDADTVFIYPDGRVRLLGFGLATEVREPRGVLFNVNSLQSEAAGESASPETMFRRDVYALALLAYRLLSGRTAYEVQAQYPNVVSRPQGLTDEAWRTLRQGLAYPSELCPGETGAFIASLEITQRQSQTVEQPKQVSFLAQYGQLIAGIGAAAIAGLVGLLAYMMWQPSPAPPIESTPVVEETQPVINAAAGREWLGADYQGAEREADRRAFESARREGTRVAYQLYLQSCPRCGYGQEAREFIERLDFQEKIAGVKREFEVLVQMLEQGKRSDSGDPALAQLKTLEKLLSEDQISDEESSYIAEGQQRVARAWVALAQKDLGRRNLAGTSKWLKKASTLQPDLPELEALSASLQKVEIEEHSKQRDIHAFEAVRRRNTRKAYWEYLDECDPCQYAADAKAALIRLSPRNRTFQDRFADGTLGPAMVVIPAGRFIMGSPPRERGRYRDEAQHPVQIKRSFAIGKYEVTFEEYDRFAAEKNRTRPSDHGWGRGQRPAIHISWHDAVAYADWLSSRTGRRYRLPTEAEWEYAIRAGVSASRYWGNDPNEGCLYANAADLDSKKVYVGLTAMKCHDGYVYTAPVGTYHDNNFGLHDMAGNVWEWTCTLYDEQYRSPVQRCESPAAGQEFVLRGGSWNDEPRSVRSADRHRSDPSVQNYYAGFRLVREL